MLIHNAKKQEDGTWDFDLTLTNDEIDYLVNLSISTLLQQGVIAVTEQEEEQEVELPIERETLQ